MKTKRGPVKQCRSLGPLSGVRCMLKAGHRGQHKGDQKQIAKFVDDYLGDLGLAERGPRRPAKGTTR